MQDIDTYFNTKEKFKFMLCYFIENIPQPFKIQAAGSRLTVRMCSITYIRENRLNC